MKWNIKYLAVGVIAAIGLATGVYVVSKKQPQPQSNQVPLPPVAMLKGDSVGPFHEGKLGLDKTSKFAHFSIGNKNVKSIFVEDKIVWIGTSGGVIRYDTTTDNYKLYDNRNGLLSNGVFYVGRLRSGLMAIGTYGGGLSLLDEKSGALKQYNIPQGLGDAFVYDVLETRAGDIWIATWSGVNLIKSGALDDRSKWVLYTVENTNGGLPNDWVYGLAEGKAGEIWLATEGGMARFENNKWDNWNHAKGIGAPFEKVKDAIEFKNDPGKASVHHAKQKQEMGLENVNVAFNPNYIVSLEVAGDGKVWVGTWGGGLSIWDGQTWTNYSSVEGLPGNHVFMLHQDAKGQMWIGTNHGLALWQNGTFKALGTADGLYDNNVFSMATAADGGMWVGSFGGVAYIKPR